MGVHLQNGAGIEKDLSTAFDLFKRAAEQDHVAAQYHLANCYERGLGCAVDLHQASIWFERAALGMFIIIIIINRIEWNDLLFFYIPLEEKKNTKKAFLY